ncbi:MAG: ABC-F family ATP-binding cassette domain-containing protein, partial [Ruminococcus sp.]|nr:ABC-F family ATP-binding cassette domain-containing protein [Ruminococcus sp.]
MNILNIEHISKVYGEKKIFDDASFGIQENDKIGIVGINGTGKTTLLKMIAGIENPDEGQIIRQNGLKIAYLPQSGFPEIEESSRKIRSNHTEKDRTVLSYMMEGVDEGDWSAESQAKTILNELGITDHQEVLEHLSGGQKKKVALAKTLVSSSDVLLLDEPTNHLDNAMLEWLEDYLKHYRGVIIMVTHDRYFLDKVTNKILEISHGSMYSYEANYSGFLELKAQREEMELASERKRQSILRMEIEWAKRGCRARTTKQKARLERLEILKNTSAPQADQVIEADSIETRMGKKTVELHHISKSYGDKMLINDFDYIVLKNQRIGFIGPNGCGKSTLMKIIAGLLEPDMGHVEIGETVKAAYFAQEVPDMNTSQRVIDYVKDVAEYIPTRDGKISASKMLERFLFTPEMQYAPIEKLSGGEKKRLYLLSILAQAPNCLIFDEPGNDLDIPTLTILEDYLNSFVGIVITVSHDRYFLDNIVDRIFAFEENGRLVQYEGGYSDYLEAVHRSNVKTEPQAQPAKEKTSKKNWKAGSTKTLKFSYKEQREFEALEEKIMELEEKQKALEEAMSSADYATSSAAGAEYLSIAKELESAYARW